MRLSFCNLLHNVFVHTCTLPWEKFVKIRKKNSFIILFKYIVFWDLDQLTKIFVDYVNLLEFVCK